MSIITAVRAWLGGCPLLDSSGRVNVDFLPAEPTNYSLDGTPINPIVKSYIDGSSLRQYAFTFGTRAYFDGAFIKQQIDNTAFYEDFSDWVEAQNKTRNLPDLGDKRAAVKVEVTSSGYMIEPGTETARYQIQLRLLYEQDADYNT